MGDYISNFLSVAIPSIVCGMGDCISLIILEEKVAAAGGGGGGNHGVGERTGGTKTIERFVFSFQMDGVIGNAAMEEANAEVQLAQQKQQQYNDNDNNNGQIMMLDMEDSMLAHRRDTEIATEARSQLERQMRACLLSVLALRKRRRRKDERPENMSFKLCLHVGAAEEDNKTQHDTSMAVDDGEVLRNNRSADSSCPELMRALRQGEWLQPEESSCLFSSNNSSIDANTTQKNGGTSKKGLLRPIKNVSLPSCGMRMQVGFEVDPF